MIRRRLLIVLLAVAVACLAAVRADAAAGPGAAQWLASTQVSAAGTIGDARGPDAVVGDDGAVTAIWARTVGSANRIEAATRLPGGPWSLPVTLTADGGVASLAVDGDGSVLAVYCEKIATGCAPRARFRDAGEKQWSAAAELSDSDVGPPDQAFLQAAFYLQGAVVAWRTSAGEVWAAASDGDNWTIDRLTNGPIGLPADASVNLTVYGSTPMVLYTSGSPGTGFLSGWERMSYTGGSGAWWPLANNADGGGSELGTSGGVAVYRRGDPSTVFIRSVIGFTPYNRWYAEKPMSLDAVASAPRVALGPNAPSAATTVWTQRDGGPQAPVRAFAASIAYTASGGYFDLPGTPTPPQAISDANAQDLIVATDGPEVVAAWSDGTGSATNELRAITGPWSGPRAVPGEREGHHPAIAFDRYGNGVLIAIADDHLMATGLDGEGPIIEPSIDTFKPEVGQSVQFSADVFDVWSADDAIAVRWDFGDGIHFDGRTGTHAYSAPGTYHATVAATDAAGNQTTMTADIIVPQRPLTATPTPTPSSSPTPGPSPTPSPPPASGPPSATLAVPAVQTLKSLVSRGLRLRVTCSSACELSGTLSLGKSQAKRLHLGSGRKPVTIGRGTARLAAAGSTELRLKLTAPARKAMRRTGHETLTVEVSASNTAGTRVTRRSVTVTRTRALVRTLALDARWHIER